MTRSRELLADLAIVLGRHAPQLSISTVAGIAENLIANGWEVGDDPNFVKLPALPTGWTYTPIMEGAL